MVPPRNGVSSRRSIEPRAAAFRLRPPGATKARALPLAPSQASETVSMPRGGRHTGAPTPRTSSPSSTTRSPRGPHRNGPGSRTSNRHHRRLPSAVAAQARPPATNATGALLGEGASLSQPSGSAPAAVAPTVVPGALGRVAPRSEQATASTARAASSRCLQRDRGGMVTDILPQSRQLVVARMIPPCRQGREPAGSIAVWTLTCYAAPSSGATAGWRSSTRPCCPSASSSASSGASTRWWTRWPGWPSGAPRPSAWPAPSGWCWAWPRPGRPARDRRGWPRPGPTWSGWRPPWPRPGRPRSTWAGRSAGWRRPRPGRPTRPSCAAAPWPRPRPCWPTTGPPAPAWPRPAGPSWPAAPGCSPTATPAGWPPPGSAPPLGWSTPRRRPASRSRCWPPRPGRCSRAPASPPGSWSTRASRSRWWPIPPPARPWPAAWSTPCWSAATGWPATATPPTRSAPTAWPCWPGPTASPSTWSGRCRRSTPRPPTAPPSRSSSARRPRSAPWPGPAWPPRRPASGTRPSTSPRPPWSPPSSPTPGCCGRRSRPPSARPWPGSADDGVGPQPGGGGLGGRLTLGHLQVQLGQLGGGELGADHVQQPHQRRPVGVQDLPAQHRDHIVGRLQAAVVGQLDQVEPGPEQAGVGGVDHADVDLARLQGRCRHVPRRHRLEAGEMEVVDVLEALEAEGPLGALGRPADDHLAGHRGQVAELLQAAGAGQVAGDGEAVAVLGRGVGQHADPAGGEGLLEPGVGQAGVGGGHPVAVVEEIERRPQVLGDHVDLALLEGGGDHLAGAQLDDLLDREAVLAQGQAVQLGQGLALGEVEGGQLDGGPARVLGRRRCRAAVAAGGQHGEDNGQQERRPPGSLTHGGAPITGSWLRLPS